MSTLVNKTCSKETDYNNRPMRTFSCCSCWRCFWIFVDVCSGWKCSFFILSIRCTLFSSLSPLCAELVCIIIMNTINIVCKFLSFCLSAPCIQRWPNAYVAVLWNKSFFSDLHIVSSILWKLIHSKLIQFCAMAIILELLQSSASS